MEDKNFIKGFNNGYLLREHEPVLLEKIMKGISGDATYLEGLREGVKQREKEINRERIKQSLETGGKDKQQDRGRERNND